MPTEPNVLVNLTRGGHGSSSFLLSQHPSHRDLSLTGFEFQSSFPESHTREFSNCPIIGVFAWYFLNMKMIKLRSHAFIKNYDFSRFLEEALDGTKDIIWLFPTSAACSS